MILPGKAQEVNNAIIINHVIEDDSVPTNLFVLGQNYPNPVIADITTIPFDLPDDGCTVQLSIFDINGNVVMNPVDNVVYKGVGQKIPIDISKLGSGEYEYRMIACGQSQTKKMVILR
jgi:hypothetical protein